ncbi:MAG: Holliday junction resolvase RuvX [Dermatophilus congolensis]|nr:Holliday junction resolvase RuvX [Dermatophilus congolensis]
MRPGIRIGVDVGSVRVGVATCDPDAILATPVRTVARGGSGGGDTASGAADNSAVAENDSSLTGIAELVASTGAIEVVVGLPRSLSGEEGLAAQTARAYAKSLAAKVAPVPVRLLDERLTTVDAHRALYSSGRSGRAHREVVDQVAAVMILQSALDAERDTGREPGELVGARKPRHRRRA